MNRSATSMLVALALLGLITIAGCGGGSAKQEASPSPSQQETPKGGSAVTISDFAFSPANIEIAVGESVTWTNEDSAAHTVTGDGGIDSGSLAQGQAYTRTFDSAGTFTYNCSIHPSMQGELTVK